MGNPQQFIIPPTTQSRASTGIAGLDTILGGGLPCNHVYLVEGNPGTGKTTLALQFLIAGRVQGESVLYVTLSETKSELTAVAASHGWSLTDIDLFELENLEDRMQADEQYTVFYPSEVELNETINRICRYIEERNPIRVVFDSLSEMRLMARDPLRYRRQVLALKQFFVARQCTVLLLDDHTSASSDLQLQSIAHGVIQLERVLAEFGGARRRLTVPKLRGLSFREGHHDFNITSGGLVVYPRLVAASSRNVSKTLMRDFVSCGVPALDRLLGNGLQRGTSTLILGPAGCGKSTVGCQYALSAARRGERVAIYIFEETYANFRERGKSLGMDLDPFLESGLVSVVPIDPAELSPGEFAENVRSAVADQGARLIIIDSLNGYIHAMPSESFLLVQMHELLTFLNEAGVLTILVMAQHGMLGLAMATPIDITYLADTVILLRYFESDGEVRQAIAVVKKRTGTHERTIREFRLSGSGISVGHPLNDFHGVLSGIPTFKGSPESLMNGKAPNGRGSDDQH